MYLFRIKCILHNISTTYLENRKYFLNEKDTNFDNVRLKISSVYSNTYLLKET